MLVIPTLRGPTARLHGPTKVQRLRRSDGCMPDNDGYDARGAGMPDNDGYDARGACLPDNDGYDARFTCMPDNDGYAARGAG